MNFLAHLVLAPPTPEGLVGAIAPDMIRGPLPAGLHASVLASAREHQSIDRFTDAHRAFLQTRGRLSALVDRRLTGVLADVLYDHVLARDWARYHSDELAAFVASAEQGLVRALDQVPERMQMIVYKMIDEQWLLSYATSAGIRARLETMSARMTNRMSRPLSLVVSASELDALYQPIADDFAQFWPDLLAHVDHIRDRTDEPLAS